MEKECTTCNGEGFIYSTHFDSDMSSPDEIPCPDCSEIKS